MGNGLNQWSRTENVVPSGNLLLKSGEVFLPEQQPSYLIKARGCEISDLDGNKFTDISIMGIGTDAFVQGSPKIDEAVMWAVQDGSLSALSCPEEVFLTERLVELHPQADMGRFAHSEGGANNIVILIGRAVAERDNDAIYGYRDWHLSANLADDHTPIMPVFNT